MRLDNLDKPETLWYEDENGNKLDVDTWNGCPEFPKDQTWYQHCEMAIVRHTILQGYVEPKWPARFLKWIYKKLPYSWQGQTQQLASGETTINCIYPIVKYLVEEKDWSFSEACVVGSRLCERCMNICLWECEGRDLALEEHYLKTSNTHCDYCKDIDPEHDLWRRVWCCYRTHKFGGNVTQAYDETTVDSAGYFECEEGREPNAIEKIQYFFRRLLPTSKSRA